MKRKDLKVGSIYFYYSGKFCSDGQFCRVDSVDPDACLREGVALKQGSVLVTRMFRNLDGFTEFFKTSSPTRHLIRGATEEALAEYDQSLRDRDEQFRRNEEDRRQKRRDQEVLVERLKVLGISPRNTFEDSICIRTEDVANLLELAGA